MSSENHLTIRDYFDRVMGGKPRNKKGLSSGRTKSPGARGFHQILTKWIFYPQLSGPPSLSKARESAKITASPSPAKIKDIPKLHNFIARLTPEQIDTRERNKIEKSIYKAAQNYNLPVNLIKSVIRAESNFQVNAVSRAGAQGLMQLMPVTARELGVKNPFDIEENIDGGSRYLRKMLDSFGGDLKLALAAYNAGPEAVIKYGGKIPPYRETQQYVRRVLRFTRQLA